jgi:hypothetical protein
MSALDTIRDVSRKKPTPVPTPDQPEKAVIYLEVPPAVKTLMEGLAREHNRRLTGECIQALQEYLARHKLWPPPQPADADD